MTRSASGPHRTQQAGEAGIAISDMIVGILLDEGLPEKDAKRRCWFVDSKGLVIAALNAQRPAT